MRKITALAVLVMLSACAPQHTKVIQPLDQNYRGALNIKNIKVTYSDLSVEKISALDSKLASKGQESGTPEEIQYQPFNVSFKEVAAKSLEERDGNGVNQADITIEVDNLKLANAVATILIGDIDQLSGSVKVNDSKTKELLSEFYVDVFKGSGGLLGLAIRGGGVREKLAAQFAEYIGDELGFEKTTVAYTPKKTINE